MLDSASQLVLVLLSAPGGQVYQLVLNTTLFIDVILFSAAVGGTGYSEAACSAYT